MTYTALHNHSEYSLTDSILRIEDIVAFAKAQGAEAIALTDRNNLYGALKLYKKARAAGIKPVIGCDLTLPKPAPHTGSASSLAVTTCKSPAMAKRARRNTKNSARRWRANSASRRSRPTSPAL